MGILYTATALNYIIPYEVDTECKKNKEPDNNKNNISHNKFYMLSTLLVIMGQSSVVSTIFAISWMAISAKRKNNDPFKDPESIASEIPLTEWQTL